MQSANRVRVRLEIVDSTLPTRGDQRFSRESSRLDCRANPFAAFWIREPCRIANEHHARTDDGTPSNARSEIGVPVPASVGDAGDDSMALEKADEVSEVFAEAVIASTSDPDVDEVTLAHAPGVSLKVTAEEQLRRRARHLRVAVADWELCLLRDNGRLLIDVRTKVTRDGAEVPPGSDDDR